MDADKPGWRGRWTIRLGSNRFTFRVIDESLRSAQFILCPSAARLFFDIRI